MYTIAAPCTTPNIGSEAPVRFMKSTQASISRSEMKEVADEPNLEPNHAAKVTRAEAYPLAGEQSVASTI